MEEFVLEGIENAWGCSEARQTWRLGLLENLSWYALRVGKGSRQEEEKIRAMSSSSNSM